MVVVADRDEGIPTAEGIAVMSMGDAQPRPRSRIALFLSNVIAIRGRSFPTGKTGARQSNFGNYPRPKQLAVQALPRARRAPAKLVGLPVNWRGSGWTYRFDVQSARAQAQVLGPWKNAPKR